MSNLQKIGNYCGGAFFAMKCAIFTLTDHFSNKWTSLEITNAAIKLVSQIVPAVVVVNLPKLIAVL